MSNYEIASLLILSISALFVGITLLFLSKQIKIFILAHADNHDWNRRIETQHALDNIREINTDSLNKKFGYVNRKNPIPVHEIVQAFEEDHALQLLLHKLLNFYEGLANGVFLGMYDEVSIKENRKGPMEREFIRFKLYIDHRRNESSQTAWIAYERLIKKWNEELLRGNDKPPTGKI